MSPWIDFVPGERMAMGYAGTDTPNILEHEFRDLAVKTILSRMLNDNNDVYCLNDMCGIEIPVLRREAIPGCRFCIQCQAKSEKGVLQ